MQSDSSSEWREAALPTTYKSFQNSVWVTLHVRTGTSRRTGTGFTPLAAVAHKLAIVHELLRTEDKICM